VEEFYLFSVAGIQFLNGFTPVLSTRLPNSIKKAQSSLIRCDLHTLMNHFQVICDQVICMLNFSRAFLGTSNIVRKSKPDAALILRKLDP
jgi:hypothetical protein